MGEHWFWWLLTAAAMVWYSTITVYVALRGILDIRYMLARLGESGNRRSPGHPGRGEGF